jgi:hypothetical protein
MTRIETTTAAPWTHRAYFKRYCLNVEQYGEILVAQVFRGTKKGDAQPRYDVETSDQNVRDGLLASGAPRAAVENSLSAITDNTVRIEVKCKLAHTSASKASFIAVTKSSRGRDATSLQRILRWFFSTETGTGQLRKLGFSQRTLRTNYDEKTQKVGISPLPL